jgi:hypothetical protein
MDIHNRNLVIALLVVVIVSGAMALLTTSAGVPFDANVVLAPGAFLGALTFYVLWNLSGNRKLARASEAQRAQALSLTPPEGQALVYVVRTGFVARAAGMDVSIDRVLRAQIKAPQFTCLVVSPGTHELSAELGGGAGRQSRPSTQQLTLAPGQALGVRVTIRMGAVQNSLAFETLDGPALQQTIRGMTMIAPIAA